MGDPSELPAEPVRLVLEFGESVEVDGSAVFDPVADASILATVALQPHPFVDEVAEVSGEGLCYRLDGVSRCRRYLWVWFASQDAS